MKNLSLSVIFILVGLLVNHGCATRHVPLKAVDAIPVWNDVDEKYSYRDFKGNVQPHPFFDLAPFPGMKDNFVNFVMVVPSSSRYSYEVDLQSGQRYFTHKFCKQKDIWEKYPEYITNPPYHTGFVPRVIDQLGMAQKIIVFGRDDHYRELPNPLSISHRVRVVGAVLEQYCQQYPCSGRGTWESRLLLIGVDPEDMKFRHVKDVTELKRLVNWPEVKAFIENGQGRTFAGGRQFPAYRIVGEIPPEKALKHALTRGHFFSFKELKTLRNGCHKLYDLLWERAEAVRNFDPPSIKEIEKQIREQYSNRNVVKDVKLELQKVDYTQGDFATFYRKFFQKHHDRLYTCSKFVRPANINENRRRHWFFTHLIGGLKLERTGHFFNCKRRAWMVNPMRVGKSRMFDPVKEMQRCSTRDFDVAYETMTNILDGLYQNNKEHFRYIDYDSGVGGSHQKIHSWVYFKGKKLVCSDNDTAFKKDRHPVFPNDVDWERFYRRDLFEGDSIFVR